MELDLSIRNEALVNAFRNAAQSGTDLYIYANTLDYHDPASDTKKINFNVAANGKIKVSGVIRLDVAQGNTIRGVTILDQNSLSSVDNVVADIKVTGVDEGDFTTTQGTYQINILEVSM